MKSKIFNYFKKVNLQRSNCTKLVIFKPILRNKILNKNFRSSIYAFSFYYFRGTFSSPKPICFATARARGILSGYYFSRITFKKFAIIGDIVGFKKSRW